MARLGTVADRMQYEIVGYPDPKSKVFLCPNIRLFSFHIWMPRCLVFATNNSSSIPVTDQQPANIMSRSFPPIGSILTSPLFSCPLLAAVSLSPHVVRDVSMGIASQLPAWMSRFLPTPSLLVIKFTLGGLFSLGLIRHVNRALSSLASNSWRLGAAKGWDWDSEFAVVTGGSSGIGKCIAEQLAALGVRVAVLDIQELPESMRGNPRISFFECDVSSSEAVAAVAESIRSLGHPSILINNAGITNPMPILKVQESVLRQMFGVNAFALWFTTQNFLPSMIGKNKGHIVTIASLGSYISWPNASQYTATKAAALAFHDCLTSEIKYTYKADNVLTTIVHPHYVQTGIISKLQHNIEKLNVKLLSPEFVAEQVVGQLRKRRSGHLFVPEGYSFVSCLRGVPTWLRMLILNPIQKKFS